MKPIPLFVLASMIPYAAFGKVAPPAFGNLPISFEANRGQADPESLYLARGNGYLLSLNALGSRITLRHGDTSAAIASRLLGSSQSPRIEALEPLPGHSSYFCGSDRSKWVTDVPNYAKVRAAGVYPGIDLIYYGNQSRLEYDFIVSPGADPKTIRLRFDGVSAVHTDAAGNLVLSTQVGEITQQKPVIYQTVSGRQVRIEGGFVVGRHRTVSFHIASYDRSKPLIIDPVLVYSSFLGGSDLDEGHAVAADRFGNLYLTGLTFSTQHGDADVLVRKISSDGTAFIYNADIGGSNDDRGNGIAVDRDGSAYVGGRTQSSDFPVANAFQNRNFGSSNNAFVLRLDTGGSNLIFSTYLGGSRDDRGFAVALDLQGSVYLTGAASSPDFPTSPGAYGPRIAGGLDCFVAKLDAQGNGVFSTLIGGGSDEQAFGIAVDLNGNSYITGQTNSDSYPQVNAPFQHSRHGGQDAFITELTADGSGLVYSTFAGGGSDDSGQGIAVDRVGNAFVVGTTSSGDFPTTNGIGYAGGNSDIFVMSFSPNGQSLIFSTLLGSHGTDEGGGIALDAADNIYVIGDTDSDQYPVTSDAGQTNRAGGFDVVLSVLDPTGNNLLYSTFFGGSGDDFGYGIALDPNGNAYLTGVTSSSDFPITSGALQQQRGGAKPDAFFAKIGFGNSSGGVSFSVTPPAGKAAAEAGKQQREPRR